MVRLPVFVRWLVITLGCILADPVAPTVRVLPDILQLVPDVPVWPDVEMDRSCEKTSPIHISIETKNMQ